jgi:hypothetical protein
MFRLHNSAVSRSQGTCRPKAALVAAALAIMPCVALAESSSIAYLSTKDWDTTYFMKDQEQLKLADLSLKLAKASRVLVQFSSELSSEHATGCPCYVRALVSMDGAKPRPLKRINVGTPAAHQVDAYDNDRQNLDATTVFEAPAGHHTFTLTFQQVDTHGDKLEVYYANAQAIAFPQ